jgi:lipoprotein-anchoring transpeptidase ErfK/SrfK
MRLSGLAILGLLMMACPGYSAEPLTVFSVLRGDSAPSEPAQTPRPSAPDRNVDSGLGGSTREIVAYSTIEASGTIIVDTEARYLYLVQSGGWAVRYRVGVGRDGFGWTGTVRVGGKAEWPDWRPPAEMRRRDPSLPVHVAPGLQNPLGARAIYLHRNGKDTLYRIHGTNDPLSVGQNTTSGCFRLSNQDVIDLYQSVRLGSKVVVQ